MKVLHIEDGLGDAEIVEMLRVDERTNCSIDAVFDRESVVGRLQSATDDLVLSGFSMGSSARA